MNNLNEKDVEHNTNSDCHNLKDVLLRSFDQIASSLSVDDYKNILPDIEGKIDIAHEIREEVKTVIKNDMEENINDVFEEYNLQDKHLKLQRLKENPSLSKSDNFFKMDPDSLMLRALAHKRDTLTKMLQNETERSVKLTNKLNTVREKVKQTLTDIKQMPCTFPKIEKQ